MGDLRASSPAFRRSPSGTNGAAAGSTAAAPTARFPHRTRPVDRDRPDRGVGRRCPSSPPTLDLYPPEAATHHPLRNGPVTIGCTVPDGTERIGPPGTLGDSRAGRIAHVDSERRPAPEGFPTWDADTLAELAPYGVERDVVDGRGAAAGRPPVRGLLRGARRRGRGRAPRRRVRAARRRAAPGPVRRRRQPAHRAAPLPDGPGRKRPGGCSTSTPDGFRRLMGARRHLATIIFESATARSETPADRPRPPRRCASSARGSRPSRWRCGRSSPGRGCRTPGSTSTRPTTPTSCWPAAGCAPQDVPGGRAPRRHAAQRHARRAGPTARPHLRGRRPATRSTSWSWAAGRPAWPPPSTGPPRASTRWRSTRSPPAARPAPARSSRTTSASPTGVSGGELADRAAAQARRLGARINAPCEVGRPAARARRSTPWCSPTAARSRPGRSSSPPARTTGGCRCPSSTATRVPASTTRPRRRGPGLRRAARSSWSAAGTPPGQAALYLAEKGCRVSIVMRRAVARARPCRAT